MTITGHSSYINKSSIFLCFEPTLQLKPLLYFVILELRPPHETLPFLGFTMIAEDVLKLPALCCCFHRHVAQTESVYASDSFSGDGLGAVLLLSFPRWLCLSISYRKLVGGADLVRNTAHLSNLDSGDFKTTLQGPSRALLPWMTDRQSH